MLRGILQKKRNVNREHSTQKERRKMENKDEKLTLLLVATDSLAINVHSIFRFASSLYLLIFSS
jgi:hypothetical protein